VLVRQWLRTDLQEARAPLVDVVDRVVVVALVVRFGYYPNRL